jgi:hypothetical protein
LLLLLFSVLGIKPRVSCTLGKCYPTNLICDWFVRCTARSGSAGSEICLLFSPAFPRFYNWKTERWDWLACTRRHWLEFKICTQIQLERDTHIPHMKNFLCVSHICDV